MKRFKVMTRETTYRVYIVEAESEDEAVELGVEGLDGKEVDYEFETINMEELTGG